jgi:hypothetical protein
MRSLGSFVLLAALVGGCAHSPPPAQAGIERWAENHPAASQELGGWVQQHINHPNQPIEGFVATHPGWQYFDRISEHHRPAADLFMAWCRRHPEAAEALMNHPGGLYWAGTHLYAGSWHMENPGQ